MEGQLNRTYFKLLRKARALVGDKAALSTLEYLLEDYKPHNPLDEGCLQLNVFTPTLDPEAKLPVMVWIHGGNFMFGTSGGSYYDGSNLARKDVVVVSVNYRLGILGFMAHPELSEESPEGVSGNYGLMDQAFALKWVNENIQAFGGDPNCVTLFGQSAGAVSTYLQMVSPKGRGLFHRVIAQSANTFKPLLPLKTRAAGQASGEALGLRVAHELGLPPATSIEKMRAMDASRLNLRLKQAPLGGSGLIFYPVVDGVVLPKGPLEALIDGDVAKVGVMAGSNADESTIFLLTSKVTNMGAFEAALDKSFGPLASAVFDFYGLTTDAQVAERMHRLTNTKGYHTPARRLARGMSELGSRSYLYRFSRRMPGRWKSLGAFHGAEVYYTHGNTGDVFIKDEFEAGDHDLADRMSSAWVNFARSGDPNGPGVEEWPSVAKAPDSLLEWGLTPRVVRNHSTRDCDFFDTIDNTIIGRG